jgi:hypothetical protein
MVTEEPKDGKLPEDDPELMYEYTEEYAEMLELMDERTLGLLVAEKRNGTRS